jgi:RNA polymerase sigma-70 factor (ECF subfamily)
MRRARRSAPEGVTSGAGLRALAELVAAELNELTRRLGTQLVPQPLGPSWLAMEATSTQAPSAAATTKRGHRIGHRTSRTDPRPDRPAEGGDEPEGGVSEEHVETWRLVTAAQGGDGEAFGQLYDRYADTVFRFIYFRVNDRALAEDFTSETFLRALRRISTISYQGRDIGAWFVTIARNIILDHIKSARNRLEITTADTVEGDQREPSPEAAVLDLLTSERLMAAVSRLGDEQRECVMLRFIQGFSVSETAAVMGKNDGAIKALQHRAVRKLAELVGNDLR